MKKQSNKLAGASILAAVAASLCCITPVLAILSGVTGIAATFSWIEPARPFLIATTILVLLFAWYQLLKPRTAEEMDCDCETDDQKPFIQGKAFLGMVTVFAALMLAFPYYSFVFYPSNPPSVITTQEGTLTNAEFKVEGMTCAACEDHIRHAVSSLSGIQSVDASFTAGSATVSFDPTRTTEEEIFDAIHSTGYTVKK
ncbi:MAG: mercuric transport protein MerTP [Cryomorphaceae bacterium]